MSQAPTPWALTLTLMIGTIAAVMGASTVNTALPAIIDGLGLPLDQASWIATAYMLANVVAIPSAAWLGRLLSPRVLFAVGVAGFLGGSILCGLAWDFSSMIAFRVVQGLAAGLIMPTAQAMLFEAFPAEKRGFAMGVYGLGALMGPSIGPTVGGWLVTIFGWRSVFFINMPFAVASLLMLGALPRAARGRDLVFDAPGFAWMAVFLTSLQLAVANGAHLGWGSPWVLGALALSGVSLAGLLWRELTTPHPLLDLRVFKHLTYNVATVISMIIGLGLFGTTFLLPLFLGNLLGYSALQIGLVMLPGSLAMGVMMLVSGRLSDGLDSRVLLAVGLLIFSAGLYQQTLADASASAAFHAWANFWRGLGMGMVFSPLSAVAIGGVPPGMMAQATGLFNLTRQLAGAIGIAAFNTLLSTRVSFHATIGEQAVARQATVAAYADVFWVCLLIGLVGLVPIALLKRPAPRPLRESR